MNFNHEKTALEGVLVITPEVRSDERGCFFETYHSRDLEEIGIWEDFVQSNQSISHRGVLRGLHFQKHPYTQGKLCRVDSGKALDVVVDIRKDSPTRGRWTSVELSRENKKMIWIPAGLAHGFLSVDNNTTFNYMVTNFYEPGSERGIAWNDPNLGIDWQLEKYEIAQPVIGKKDLLLPNYDLERHVL